MNIEKVLQHYVEAALWSSSDESDESGGEPLDQNFGMEDIAPECLAQMREDVEDFVQANEDDLMTWDSERWSVEEMTGHDFWLTRNGHGAGFWDGDWDDEVGKRLTEASKVYGDVYLYVGDGGFIYC